MKLFSRLLVFSILFVLAACTPSQETTDTKNEQAQDIYVFDDVGTADSSAALMETPDNNVTDSVSVELPPPPPAGKFIVQVGAFTTSERAQTFVDQNQSKINWKMGISYSEQVQLYVVQLTPFETRTEAEYVRNQLWLIDVFKDAFIVP